MEEVVPWTRFLTQNEPHYLKRGARGRRPPVPLGTMLRVYFLQQWYARSDPTVEEMLYDSDAVRRFAGIELGNDRIPDETTIRTLLNTQILALSDSNPGESIALGRRTTLSLPE